MRPGLGLALILSFLAGDRLNAGEGTAEYLGTFVWERPEDYFGGVSGLEVSEDGLSFSAVGDDAQTMIGTFERNGAVIAGIASPWIGGLKDQNGDRLRDTNNDAEGLAIGSDGAWVVSFERRHGLRLYADREANGKPYPTFRMFNDLPFNRSLEALAIDTDGRLYAVAEGRLGDGFPVFRFADGDWSLFDSLSAEEGYQPVGADIGPDGFFYLLERKLRLPYRFGSKVRRFEMSESGLINPVLIFESALGAHDNLEGISVWHDGQSLRITMVSDDNYSRLQQTEFVEYRITE